MKKIVVFNLFFFILGIACAKTSQLSSHLLSENKTSLIDANDTVVFDLSNATLNGSNWSFPVLILSDDTVNALDFSFKYNHAKMTYDSITDLTNYMQPLAFYNPNDSTVRFTSNSFQRYANNTALVNIHFTLLSGQLDSSDLFSIKVYLNGNVCSLQLSTLIATGIATDKSDKNSFHVFPNPAKDEFFLEDLQPEKNSALMIVNERGELVYKTSVSEKSMRIQTEKLNLSCGYYFINLSTEKSQTSQKLLLTK